MSAIVTPAVVAAPMSAHRDEGEHVLHQRMDKVLRGVAIVGEPPGLYTGAMSKLAELSRARHVLISLLIA